MNIINKINNIYLEYDLIYDTFFFLLKCFVFRFLLFYRTEKKLNQTGDILNLNCILIETYRNLNYIGFVLNIILKKIFKNKEKDYLNYLKDFNEFVKFNKNLYIKQYSVNASNNLLLIFINHSDFSLDTNNKKNYNSNNKFKFHEKYNELLIQKSKDGYFSDYRSCFIDLLNEISHCIRDLNLIFEEEKNEGQMKKIMKTIQYIICLFYDKFAINSAETNPNSKIFIQGGNQKNFDPIKYNAQLLLEMQLLAQMLKKYESDAIKEKANIAYSIILGYLGKLKNIGTGNIKERDIFSDKELAIKNNLINSFLPKYSFFYKIFSK
jgi:hypothetical protein